MPSLEELMAFNEEVASLPRAGVPFDLGLAQLSRDPTQVSRRINAAITRRVEEGATLLEAVTAESQSFSPAYQSLVIAGLRCGSLPSALEALGRYSQPMQDVRQTVRSSLIYPTIICLLAYVLFAGACVYLWPRYDQLFADIDSTGGLTFNLFGKFRDWLTCWIAIPPVLLIALAFRWKKARLVPTNGKPLLLGRLPAISRITLDQRRASLAELTALLVEHDVPLAEAIGLAARASGETQIANEIERVTAESAEPLLADSRAARQLPPLVRWAIGSSREAEGIAHALRTAAKVYQHRSRRNAAALRRWLPPLLCVVIAGGVTLLFCLAVFVPLVRMIWELG